MPQAWETDWGVELAPDWGPGEGDAAFDNGAYVPDAAAMVERLAAKSAAFRTALGDRARLGVAYGDHPRMALDLFLPQTAPEGLMVYIHGGYWHMRHRSDWSALAQGALARNVAVAMPSYPLAPEVSIAEISEAVAQALAVAAEMVAGPIFLCGHSAGGHLAARMACADGPLDPEIAARLMRVTSISGLHDLRPFLHAPRMNQVLKLSADMSSMESPALTVPWAGLPVTAWVGAQERSELIRQSKILAAAWGEGCQLCIAPGVNHFSVIEPLEWTKSPLLGHILNAQDCDLSPSVS